jgi:hypothetical protein
MVSLLILAPSSQKWAPIFTVIAIDASLFVKVIPMSEQARTLPRWKVDLVKETIGVIEQETRCVVTVEKIARRGPSLSSVDIQLAIKSLQTEQNAP